MTEDTKIPIKYLVLAVLAGIIISFGIVGMFAHPVPFQVQVQQYKPAEAPVPAIPTIAPVVKTTEVFAPAPAPVVVTTQPLPTITPDNTTTNETYYCNITGDMTMQTMCLVALYPWKMTMGIYQMLGLFFMAWFVWTFLFSRRF